MTILDDRAAKAIQEAMDARVRALSANHPTTHMAEVIEIDQAGVTWVHIFGGADRTPAIRSLAQVKKGDLVTVTIEDGVVTINGSSSNPAASVEYVEAADYAIAEYAKQAMAAVLGDVLQVKEAIIGRATIEDLTAVEATVQTLTASYANLNEIVAGKANIVDLTAATGRISQLEADDVTINGKITAAEGRIGTIESDYLKTTDMDAEVARVGTLLAGYAEVDLANVNNAWIENGVIKDAAITNEMVGSLSANKLTAGTINGANINVTNLNADNITAGTINGQRIGQGSLSLDKLAEDVYTESEVDSIVDGLNDRIDGAIETHTGTVVPTLNNSPASSWNTTDLKDEHIGDVYYVVNSQSQQNGYCYRFTKTGNTYSWQLIKDSDVTAALSRLETAEGKITTFDSDISTLKTDTGELKTKTQSLETSLGDKVDTSTFNELSSTVDENSSTITSMSTVLTNNGLTSSTNITQTVNSVSQTATSNSSTISQLATTLGTNVDGTSKAGDIVHRTSAVEQDLSTFKTTVSSTYATQTSVENAQADATKALNRQTAYFATSSTGATTTAKTASSSNFPTLVAGVTVTVRFSTANTSTSAITLNVNSTGAKTIYVNGATTASGNQLLWSANANITFTYDGTYWRVVSEPRTWYGTCSTAAGTAAKTSTINEIVVCKGTVIKLNMTYANTSTTATMNITSTGAKNLYYGTTTTRPTTANGYGWGASSTATFVFDGQYWRVGDTSVVARLIQAESTISSHTTSIEQNATNIALKANSSEVYTKTQTDGLISTEVTNRNAAITAASNSITASVEEMYATKTALADGLEDANDYTDSEISSAKAAIKVTTDGITSEVSKISSAKYVNSSTASWTLANIKIYAAEGHSENWNVASTSDLRVGDTVYVKGTDATRNCPIYIKTTVTAINSATNFTGTSHGYEDVLPVETIKSTINQSSDSVKIAANHVNIEGATIFTNGRLSQTNLDNAYDANGAAATAKNEAISAAATDATNKANAAETNAKAYVDALEIGGRNLLRFTSAPNYVGVYTTWTVDLKPTGWYSYRSDCTVDATSDGLKFTSGSSSNDGFVIPLTVELESGEEYILSFDYRGTKTSTGALYVLCRTTPNVQIAAKTLDGTGAWAHFEAVVSWTGLEGKTPFALLVPYGSNSSGWIEIKSCSMKLEKGSLATGWTPAPEDIVDEEQYIYCLSDSVLNVPSTPDIWVNESGESVFEDEALRKNLFEITEPYDASDFVLTRSSIEDGLVRLTPTTSAAYAKVKVDYLDYTDYEGKVLTASFEAKLADVESEYTSENVLAYLGVNLSSRTTSIFSSSYDRYVGVTFSGLTTDWQRFTLTKSIPDDLVTGQTSALAAGNYVTLEVAASGSRKPVDVRGLKLSVGEAVDAPVWSTKPPKYRSYYPITFVSKQRRALDGSITCTEPVMDDTATIIDGDHIITGTIDALRVKVVNLNANNITSGLLDAGRIESGTISVSMFSDEVSSTFALSGDVAQSFADIGNSLSDMETDLSGQIDAISANAQAANSTATAASNIANSLNDTVNGTSTAPGLVDRVGNVESRVNITTIGEGESSQPAIILDASGGQSEGMAAVLTNTALSFTDQGTVVSYISNRKQYITDLEVTGEAQLGNFAFIPMSDESLAFKWVSSAIISPNVSLYTPADYCAYQIPLYKALQPEVTYRIDLYDVDVSHAGKTDAELGVGVWYCGAMICLGIWKGTAAFSNGHADHLSMVFTPHMDSAATVSGTGALMPPDCTTSMSHSTATSANPPYIRLYNSFPNADGAKNMVVGSWDLTIESE